VQTTPLLYALMRAIPDKKASGLLKPHEAALHELLLHEILAARDVPLSIAMPQDKRISELAHAALANPGSIASVGEWLTGASASRKTIERLFIAETGMPPSRWLRHARILQAVSELAAGKKVSSVALDLGYESPSAFTYMFRSALGMSPRRFLRSGNNVD
jgi:AraC-like DNA-binding protein